MTKILTLNTLAVALFLCAASSCQTNHVDSKTVAGTAVQAEKPVPEPKPTEYRFGLPVDSFQVVESIVEKGESFGNILLNYGVDYSVIHHIANEFKDIFDVRYLRSGRPYSLFCENSNNSKVARYMVYQPTPVDYYVFDLSDSAQVKEGHKEVTTRVREVSGVINSSLYESLMENGASPQLVVELSAMYAWSIDFFRIKKGDTYKVIYEQHFIDDTTYVGMGRIMAADFSHGGESFYSFFFEKGEDYWDYFDEKGNTLRKAFLKAPLKFSRISSRYSPRRFHPVLKRYRSHLGTDYAAPRGTPIMATADGEVIAASYTSGNGNYVKIRHNATYTTQYLHMTKFAKGMRRGKIVKQGDVIGYVGSTGLATGPHVCYRFWVNGRQVDPYRQELPEADPIKPEYRNEYMGFMQDWKERLDQIEIKSTTQDEGLYMASAQKGEGNV
ncbi:MAG: peptidoglycan DD-metalloendopeptidase family protein [Owenweeksia sp.]|nr:peptidoglycan DD-metalloendopeptidase family protein [Owenweeksia sp.]